MLAWASATPAMAFASVNPTPSLPIWAPLPPAPLTGPAALPPVAPASALPVERRPLPDGLAIVVERRPGAPRVAIEVVWPGGLAAEAADRAGATAILAAAITAACQPEAVDDGGALTARAGRGHLAVRGTWPVAAWRDGLRTARTCPGSAAVTAVLAATRDRLAVDAGLTRTSAAQRATVLAARIRWGTHPLGTDPHRAGRALASSALRAHQEAQLGVAPIVVVVGDVTLDDLAAELAATGPWRTVAPPPAVPAPPVPATRELFAELPGDAAAIALALPGLCATDPDRAALEILAAILADPAGPLAAARDGAVLTVALPEADDLGGLVIALAGGPPMAPRVAALEQALATLATDGPDPALVERTRARLLAADDRPELRAAALAQAALAGAPDPRTALAAVDIAAVARVAAASLRWDEAVRVTVQPPDHAPAVDRLMHRPGRAPHPVRWLRPPHLRRTGPAGR